MLKPAALLIVALNLLAGAHAAAPGLVRIPKGKVEAIWLTPKPLKTKSAHTKKNDNRIYISVDSFMTMKKPVTVGEFKTFLAQNPKWQRTNVSPFFVDEHYLSELDSMQDAQPMTFVSWYAARAYCETMDLRLPTMHEWEYMAAASELQTDANRDEKFLRRILNWYGEPKGKTMRNAGTLYKNKHHVWDLHGVIWEWVDDFNTNFVTGESREDGEFNKDMFCGAGGQLSSDKSNYAAFMRFAFRSGLRGQSSIWNLGFRCVRSL